MREDPSLLDQQLQDEIDLVGALVLAASQTERPLTPERIDEILGVARRGARYGGGLPGRGPGPCAQVPRPDLTGWGRGRCWPYAGVRP